MSAAPYDPLPAPLSIARLRADHVAHMLPEHADSDALMRLAGLGPGYGHEFVDLLVKENGSVSLGCHCHEPVTDGDLILGLRPAAV